MAVTLSIMRELLMPGLAASFKEHKEIFAANIFNEFNEAFPFVGNIAEPAFTLDEICQAEDIIQAITASRHS